MVGQQKRQEQQRRKPKRSTTEAAKEPSTNVTMMATEASVVLSWYEFFVRDNKIRGLFVALWPPTILAFASYFHQKRMEEQIETIIPSGLGNVVTELVGGR